MDPELGVTPCEGVGVEIRLCGPIKEPWQVTPCEGVGVEIQKIWWMWWLKESRLARAWE